MKSRIGLLVLCVGILAALGCGGSGVGQQSSASFDITVLQVEGEYLIHGTVFNDINGDGIYDAGEPGIEGVTVSLVGVEDTVTDSMGMYSFGVTVSRAYTVTEIDPVGYVSTTPNEVVVAVTGENVTVDFGDQAEMAMFYSISGYVFHDLNMNGMMDSGEPGIPDVTVSIEGGSDVMTGMDGGYAFAVMDTGLYTVIETDPEGYISTTPNEVMITVMDTNMGVWVDFGDRQIEEVDVDVKPGSDINPLNLRSKGVLPVAIMGSEEFDVTQLDPATLLLNGVAPLRWSYEDVCGPDSMGMDPDSDQDEDEMPDGYEDMTLKFSTPEIASTLGDVERGDIVTLTMTGSLLDGTPASGEEMVWIVQVQK